MKTLVILNALVKDISEIQFCATPNAEAFVMTTKISIRGNTKILFKDPEFGVKLHSVTLCELNYLTQVIEVLKNPADGNIFAQANLSATD
ncbi:uncharacterized protein FIBRA_08568 [Fibroporia radiculosa]|uniref:Uncharacterized protein n=1 Tax=Fibroporia radiculosa TaxID=599839 RepID=J4ICF4_9APHY|nr:uncharacterized protein FIBRA_08568 [Fibroporia radiculosa]CCM06316.1 predicted protein [Fibroporia radiculosa]